MSTESTTTALVTGGGGFVGRALVKRLLGMGMAVRSFARGDYPALREMGAETARGDLADPHAVKAAAAGCDVIFHVAAKAGAWGSVESFYKPNVTGTSTVLAACREHGIRKLVYTSTPSVATGRRAIEGADESVGYAEQFDSPYGETKAIAERMVLAANGDDLATVALRPRLIWGPGDTQIFPRIVERAQRGTPIKIGTPPILIDTTYIDNCVDAHILAYQKLDIGAACAGKAYFISNGDPRDVGEIIDRMCAVAGVDAPAQRIGRGAALTAAGLIEMTWRLLRRDGEPPLTRMVVLGLSTPNYFDISAARKELGYEPKVGIEEGFERLAAWYQAQ
ncbi:MAG: NAD-dependent epimerase/dehydratase family protein [Anaerolineae bacterium]